MLGLIVLDGDMYMLSGFVMVIWCVVGVNVVVVDVVLGGEVGNVFVVM